MSQPPRFHCPLPQPLDGQITLAHGGGGSIMHRLIENVFYPALDNPLLRQRSDAAVFEMGERRCAFTTDTYVVRPLAYPGGSIGSLAVYGTVNDLAAAGARPLYLSAGFILEEGLPMPILEREVRAMKAAADSAGVMIVTGDTKVIDSGSGDGMFINTAGIGLLEHDLQISPFAIAPGDVLIINGDLGRHGTAVMAAREGFEVESSIQSDAAPLADLVQTLITGGIDLHCIRDLTRGGLAGALNELAGTARMEITIRESNIPVDNAVASFCEILGLDPLYVANEGRMVFFIPANHAPQCLDLLRAHPHGHGARVIGTVTASTRPLVVLQSRIGTHRILDMLTGDQLPRIC